jgi:hypothetical protein
VPRRCRRAAPRSRVAPRRGAMSRPPGGARRRWRKGEGEGGGERGRPPLQCGRSHHICGGESSTAVEETDGHDHGAAAR